MTPQQKLIEDILKYRHDNKTFQQSVQSRSADMNYMFYDGPPFPSGDPHYGHLLQSTVKDMLPRWMTMRGYRVQRRWGRDCHGIPAENAVNKELGITSRKQVEEEFGVQQYVEECRKMVNNVNDRRKWFVDHVGRWVDMDNAYFTMDINFMEAVIGVFSELYDKNLIYKGFKVLGYSTALGTALSHSEIAEGYEDRQDPAVTVKFRINGHSEKNNKEVEHTSDGAMKYVRCFIKNKEGRILNIHQQNIDCWVVPGGKVDIGETPDDAIKREIKEEIGVEITNVKFLGAMKTVFPNGLRYGYFYEAEIEEEAILAEPDMHNKLRYCEVLPSENSIGMAVRVDDLILDDADQVMHQFNSLYFYHLLKNSPNFIGGDKDEHIRLSLLARTTTPRTLPANMFLAVNPQLVYSIVFDTEAKEYFVVAKNLLHKFYKTPEEYVLIYDCKGKDLVGLAYTPLYDYYYQSTNLTSEFHGQLHKVLAADFVTDQDGTGIAHEAPAFGEDDYDLVASVLPRDRARERLFCPVDAYGQFTDEVPERQGRNVIECNQDIIKDLKQKGLLVKQETINHSYPHCPRTGLPLIYKAIESRFVKEDELKAKTIPATEPINFVPSAVKTRFVNGLQSAPDWNISRTRFRGAPLPVREAENEAAEPLVLGSLEEIYQLSKTGSKNISKHIFIRHAQGTHNATEVWDDFAELTDLGWQQAASSCEEIKSYLGDAKPVIIISPMQRCFQTILPYLGTVYSQTEIDQITEEYYKVHEHFETIDGDIIKYVHDAASQKRYHLYDKVYVDFRLLEILIPDLRHKSVIHGVDYKPTRSDEPAGINGESVFAVQRRVEEYLKDIATAFPTETIIHASHSRTATLFEKMMYDFDYTSERLRSRFYKNAEWRVYYYDTDRCQGVDLHKPYVDAYWFEIDGVKYKRISEVLDCRFESGSMPYAEYHRVGRPLQTDRKAHFIAEGLDQTRGRFRSLHVLSTALQDRATFDNVAVTGMILAEDGKKMSKSKKNYPDPTGLLEKYGADAFRLYVLNSPVVRSEPLRFSEKGVEQTLKDVIIPLENVRKFFATYAQVDQRQHPGTQVRFMRHAHAEETEEVSRTQQTPVTPKGEAELDSPEFRENIHRTQPDIIIVSEYLRAVQTAQKVQMIMREDFGKEVEIVEDTGFGGNGMPETIGTSYTHCIEKYKGKRILIVSHNLRFRHLWSRLFGIDVDMRTNEMKKRYGIGNIQIVPLPLSQIHDELDQRLFAELHDMIRALDTAMSTYYFDAAAKIVSGFIDKLSNRYVRRSRRRFRSSGMDEQKYAGYYTLFEVIRTYLLVLAPFVPFVTEGIWQQMKVFVQNTDLDDEGESSVNTRREKGIKRDKNSVHLQYRPISAELYVNAELMNEIATVRKVISGALFIRAKNKIKIKQPLKTLKFKI